jgi:signal transduction histidine kinase
MDAEQVKASRHKLLPFRVPLDRNWSLGRMPHDIERLCRPMEGADLTPVRPERQGNLMRDVRAIVSSLEMFTRLLEEPGVPLEEHRHYARDLVSLTGALSSLMEQVTRLEGAAVPSAKREPTRARTEQSTAGQQDAGSMVKNCESLLAAVAGPKVGITVTFERALGELVLSGEQLTQVMMHLVQNATEAMPQGGQVAITVRRGPGATDSAIITVRDTGCGIPAHALGRIFQVGFTSKSSSERWPAARHHGLGLTVVRDLVASVGGNVRVTSTLKKGTSLEVEVPCRRYL